MVFSGDVFLFFFLPLVLLFYYVFLRGRKLRNWFLTIASLVFYAWGEPRFVVIMLLSIFVNWLFGFLAQKYRGDKIRGKITIALMCVYNLGILGVFKYLMFIIRSVNAMFSLNIAVPEITLPIGISFFTFQAMSYVIDVYRGKGERQVSFMNVCLYISFFPQLIAGPIVRYETVANEIDNRKETVNDFTEGCRRFMVGLSKKVLIANNLAGCVDALFPLTASTGLSVLGAWLAAIAYLMQVYYDFGGYSDMAIGLGRMFGFHFLENFNYPFISKSVTEFWRRWHISLGSWFRDYLFFPLGGSRVKSKWRLAFNMFMVWFLTGLWHGADLTYALWGCSFFAILIIERLTGLNKYMENHKIGHLYAMGLVVTVTVLIRSSSIGYAWDFIKTMFFLSGAPFVNDTFVFMVKEFYMYVVLGVVCGLPIIPWLEKKLGNCAWLEWSRAIILMVLLVISISFIITGSYNPFIYFNF